MIRWLAVSPGDGGDLRAWFDGLGRAGWPAALIREPACPDLAAVVDLAAERVPTVVLHARTPGAAALAAARGLLLHLPDDGRAPPPGPFGASVHDEAGVDARLAAGASYVVWSPLSAPSRKPATRPPLGEERFLAHARGRPVLALGGVTPEVAGRLLRRGAAGVAVLGGLGPRAERAAEYLAAG